jgi:hypothetical protein
MWITGCIPVADEPQACAFDENVSLDSSSVTDWSPLLHENWVLHDVSRCGPVRISAPRRQAQNSVAPDRSVAFLKSLLGRPCFPPALTSTARGRSHCQTLGALLVEHAGDIEAAVTYITDVIDPQLWQAAADVLKSETPTLGKGNFDPDGDDDLWVMPSDWATDPSQGMDYEEDAWFNFSVKDTDQDEDVTSLASFLGTGVHGNGTALVFRQEMLKGRKWKGVLAGQDNALQAIRDAGFIVEQREGRIELPVTLDRGVLARALNDEDPAAAFGPLRDALTSAIAAKPHFDELVAAARVVAYA